MTEQQFKLRWLLHYVHPDLFKLPLMPQDINVTFVMRGEHWEEPPDPLRGNYVFPMFRIYDSDNNIVYQTTNTRGDWEVTVMLKASKKYKFVEMRSDPQCYLADDYEFTVSSSTTEITIMHKHKYYLFKPCIDTAFTYSLADITSEHTLYDNEILSASASGRVGIEIYWHNKDGSNTLKGKYFPAHTTNPNYKVSSWARTNRTSFDYDYYPAEKRGGGGANAWIFAAEGGTPAQSTHKYKCKISSPEATSGFLFPWIATHGQKVTSVSMADMSAGGLNINIEWYEYDYLVGFSGNEPSDEMDYTWLADAWGGTQILENGPAITEQAVSAIQAAMAADGKTIGWSGLSTGCCSKITTGNLLFTRLSLAPQSDQPQSAYCPYLSPDITGTTQVTLAAYTDGMTYADYSNIINKQGYVRAFTSEWYKVFGGEYEYNPNYT